MATIRSVPLHISGKDYELRFEQPDVIAIEEELKIGYIFLFEVRDDKTVTFLSFRLVRSLIHRGLRVRNAKGEFEYAFSQGATGANDAGDLIEKYLEDGGRLVTLWEKSYEAFGNWFPKPKPGQNPGKPLAGDEKNSRSSG